MSVERYEPDGPPALLADEHYMALIPRLAEQLARSSMCPEQFRGKPDEIAIVGYALADNGFRLTLSTLPQCYVVHGRPGYMAQLQIAMVARAGCCLVPLDEESDATTATVRVFGKDGQWHRVTVTMAEAELAGWPKRNPNYKTMPDRMLMARAVTKAVDRHFPEAKLGLAGTPVFPVVDVDQDSPGARLTSGPGREVGPEAPGGATDRERRRFHRQLMGLGPDQRRAAKQVLADEQIPAPRDPDLTSEQAARAEDLIYTVIDRGDSGADLDGEATVDDEPYEEPWA